MNRGGSYQKFIDAVGSEVNDVSNKGSKFLKWLGKAATAYGVFKEIKDTKKDNEKKENKVKNSDEHKKDN